MRIGRVVRGVVAAVSAAMLLPAVAAPASATVPGPVRVAAIEPGEGALVGVGHPVVVRFTAPVADRAAAQRSLTVSAPVPVSGRFEWRSEQVMEFHPEGFWPAHSEISVGVGGVRTSFGTAAKVLGVADIDAHTFTVSIDDEVVRTMPASMGKPKFPTPTGSFTVLAKERQVVMDSRTIGIPLDDPEGYRLTVDYAVRITWGGVYIHSAPWSVGSQGYANVSHGCINLSPENAAWYFERVRVGDPVIVRP